MRACIIWTPDGAWLQSPGWDGMQRSSWMGRRELESLKNFCVVNSINLVILRGVSGQGQDNKTRHKSN